MKNILGFLFASLAFLLVGCPGPVLKPAGIGSVDQLMDDLAKRAATRLGSADNFKVVVTQADYPVGTLMQAGRTIPVNFVSCLPTIPVGSPAFAPEANTPSLFPEYTLSKNLAIDIGLENDAIAKLVTFGVNVKDNDTIKFQVKTPKIQMLADNDLSIILARADCKASIPAEPVWLIRGYISGKRDFVLTSTNSAGISLGTKIGKFDVSGGGNAAVNLTDDAQIGFLQIISQVTSASDRTIPPVISTPVVPQNGGKVYIQRDRLDTSGKGAVLAASLTAANFNVASGIEAIDTRRMPRVPQVRYFNDSDKARAEAALLQLKSQFPNATLSRVTLPAPAGQLEIWLPRVAGDS